MFKHSLHRAPASRRDVASVKGSQPVKPASDDFFYTDISIGTPPQKFTVMVLTTIAYAWVPDSSCLCPSICGGDPNSMSCLLNFCDYFSECCQVFVDNGPPYGAPDDDRADVLRRSRGASAWSGNVSRADGNAYGACSPKRHRFDSSKSSTYKRDGLLLKTHFNFSYIDNWFGYGFMGYDTVQLGGLSVQQAMFGQASKIRLDSYQQGVLGFGPSATLPTDVESPVVSAFKKGLIDQPIASLWWDDSSHTYELSYGGVDAAKCEAVKAWHSITADTDGYESGWYLAAVSVTMGNTTVKAPITRFEPFSESILQTSEKTMYKLLNGVGIDLWQFNCSISFNLMLTIDTQEYVFPSADIVVPSFGDTSLCMLDIDKGDDDELVIGGVGGVATRFCQALDIGNNRFGFAPMLST
ncbi:aspartic protease 2B [Aphelenchoides avenae]|nr:aspartic protease 2B [Aphelenchus avenae]